MMSQLKKLNDRQSEVLDAFECIDAVDTARNRHQRGLTTFYSVEKTKQKDSDFKPVFYEKSYGATDKRTFVKLKESDRKRSFVSRRRLRELLLTDGEPFSQQESDEFWNFLDSVGGRRDDNVEYENFVKKITEEALFNFKQ
ncbi:Oidioi.mRNA.OKI2018_I69.chr1.g3527.t1.cds [Oikopleura dioica]|uniref:Oidioi.mRNA.OKI2018_I69.chr1.g3527.t1.cds n=1 Tax=Oikopleura dioica TaxID=34765 RepID=A0ABN7SYP1_OIKDI|nr:Oidioi.mRNA.OKI2018_I69.chr1.g3527.t1.cds [Oikopleura dioica]